MRLNGERYFAEEEEEEQGRYSGPRTAIP